MKLFEFTLLSTLGLPGFNALSIAQRAKGAATVDLSKTVGPAEQVASGWIYGFPDNGIEAQISIPDSFIQDVKFGASRAGGAQLPARGWWNGYDEYVPRLNSTISNYRSTRKYGGDFIVLVHDLWGADGTKIPLYPGDDGDWTETDKFLQQVVDDIQSNDILEGLVLDIWNEPELDIFWDRSLDQFLEYYVHAHNFFREKLPGTLISGPSMARAPTPGYEFWTRWLSTIAEKDTIPDIYSWHQIGTWSRQPDTTVPDFNTMKAVNSLPDRPIDVNEYAAQEEQTPACSVYYIAQLERHNLRGLRAHWGSTGDLHDDISNIIFRDENDTYRPNGEYQLYKYYADMEGDRIVTTASPDLQFDVFATRTGSGVKMIAGTRNVKASYEIQVSGLSNLGLPEAGTVDVRTYQFNWSGRNGEITSPEDLGISSVEHADGMLTLLVNPATNATAYAYEIMGVQSGPQ